MKISLPVALASVLAAAGLGFGVIEHRRAEIEADRLRTLERDVSAVQAEVLALRIQIASSPDREIIRQLIAEDRTHQEQAKKAELDRVVEKRSLAWSEQVAKDHKLTDEQRQGLLKVFEMQRSRADEWMKRFSASPDVDAINAGYYEIVDWRRAELEKRMDPQTAREISRDPFWLAGFQPSGTAPR